MSDLEGCLILCFSSVLQELTETEIHNASTDSVGVWDSLSSVTLAAVIQEEFNLEIDPEILPSLESFEGFRDYLKTAAAAHS